MLFLRINQFSRSYFNLCNNVVFKSVLLVSQLNAICMSKTFNAHFRNTIRFAGTNRTINYYNTLGLKSNCKTQDICKSYENLSKEVYLQTIELIKSKNDLLRHHIYLQYKPGGPKASPEQYQRIIEAYRVLSNQETRQIYDAQSYGKPLPRYDNTKNKGKKSLVVICLIGLGILCVASFFIGPAAIAIYR